MANGMNEALPAVLFLQSAMMTLDAYSTFESSPWTAENFGADEEKAASCKEYLAHAVCYSLLYAAASSILAESVWPMIGSASSNLYLIWLYLRALRRGAASGSENWANA